MNKANAVKYYDKADILLPEFDIFDIEHNILRNTSSFIGGQSIRGDTEVPQPVKRFNQAEIRALEAQLKAEGRLDGFLVNGELTFKR